MLQQELENLRIQMEGLADREQKQVLNAYKRALNDLRGELGLIYSRYSNNGRINISKVQRYRVMLQLSHKLKQQVKALFDIDLKQTEAILRNVFKESFKGAAFLLKKYSGISIDFSILRPEFVKAAVQMPIKGEMFSERIWSNKMSLVKRLRTEVERGMIQGESIDKLARRIKKQFGVSAYESKRLMHTELARCMTAAQDEVYKNSGVVERIMFDARLDQKTSEICRGYHGEVFDINTDYPKPPLHPNCRSCIIPVVDGWSPNR